MSNKNKVEVDLTPYCYISRKKDGQIKAYYFNDRTKQVFDKENNLLGIGEIVDGSLYIKEK